VSESMTYCAELDIVLQNKNKHKAFLWDGLELPATLPFNLQRENTVIMMYACGRVHGGMVELTPDRIDYRIFGELADPKFKSQRSLVTNYPPTTSLLYFSGKMLCVGGDTPLASVSGLFQAACVLENYRMPGAPQFVIGHMRVVNGVMVGNLGSSIDLERLADVKLAGITATYEQDSFPGVILRPKNKGDEVGTITVFERGKFILAGPSTLAQVELAMERLDYILNDRRMPDIRAMPDIQSMAM